MTGDSLPPRQFSLPRFSTATSSASGCGRTISEELAPSCAAAGAGNWNRFQLLLGHASIQTTERYLGTRQNLADAPNDRLGLEWKEKD